MACSMLFVLNHNLQENIDARSMQDNFFKNSHCSIKNKSHITKFCFQYS